MENLDESKKNIPWVEKYRPETVDDISHQDEIIKSLKTAISEGNIPHLLFYGLIALFFVISSVIFFVI
jgi:replication factor C subunit 3/5